MALFLLSLISLPNVQGQALDLELEDPEDLKLLNEEFPEEKTEEVKADNKYEDQLDALKQDMGNLEFTLPESDEELIKQVEEVDTVQKKTKDSKVKIVKESEMSNESGVFDVGAEEKMLLEIAKNMQGKIPDNEWNEIANATSQSTYTVVKDDWLWKISKRIFGSGFYYSKIWALNPYITNPHEIEPGMVLSFTTGNTDSMPRVKVGSFDDSKNQVVKNLVTDDFDKWGYDAKPEWIDEKKRLQESGTYVQYSTAETDADLAAASAEGLITEYKYYEPPRPDFDIEIPSDQYDSTGIDNNITIEFNFKEGFHLNTFVSANVVQDFGKVESAIYEKAFLDNLDRIYVRFDENIDVIPGDLFSIYSSQGEVSHANSDRRGYRYTITGAIKVLQKHTDVWECEIIGTTEPIQREDRITVYTPRIERITKTFNDRIIESAILANYKGSSEAISYGDVVYIDRGRADGVEIGNVFEVFGFKDRGTERKITDNPSYKNGELTILTVTDNFATALVTNSSRDFYVGDLAVTKTKKAAALVTKLRNQKKNGEYNAIENKALDELDVNLNLDDMSRKLLDEADKVQFTEDELAELERQEREKSIMSEGERDLRALERLEKDIETAEAMLNEARLDEDKILEGQSLNEIESNMSLKQQESLDEIEENFGKRYLDEKLNDKDNPFGLTEFDIEEVDELLNIDKDLEAKRPKVEKIDQSDLDADAKPEAKTETIETSKELEVQADSFEEF